MEGASVIAPLLAKKPRGRMGPVYEETLVGHTVKTCQCFQAMFGSPTDGLSALGNLWLQFFKVDDRLPFLTTGFISAILHDLGKANSGFQQMIRKGSPQAIYHEHLGGLLLVFGPVRTWLRGLPGYDEDLTLASVIGHHLRVTPESFAKPLDAGIEIFEVYWEGIYEIMTILAKDSGMSPPSLGTLPAIWSWPSFLPLQKEVMRRFSQIRRRLDDIDEELLRMLFAVRSALIVADSAASGLVREGLEIESWIREAFDSPKPLTASAIEEWILQPRIREIRARRGHFAWTDFQIAAEGLPERALLLAPCGSGKTLGAWRWIKSQLRFRPRSRVIFLYPTRATATEGFRDYVSWAPESDAALLSGTSAYELDGMFSNPEDIRAGRDYRAEARLFSLAYWQRRVFSATVDQFFGFLQYAYSSVCLLPVLVDSVIVVDEAHSFDRKLFTALKGLLKTFQVPVLCMTASLPINRRRELIEECGLRIFPNRDEEDDFPSLEAKARMPRYQVQCVDGDEIDGIVTRALDSGKRVLWVVNTVARCQQFARPRGCLCYHSRFRLNDRKERHRMVIGGFQQKAHSVLAVTTQVCEMSLDLDADVLISEFAPITSLIQRMGRCNRHAEPGSDVIGQVYLYRPEEEKTYSPADFDGVAEFAAAIHNRVVSQTDLEELLEQFGPRGLEPDRYTAFLESGPWASSREESLRDIEEYNVAGILDTDRAQYFALRKAKQPIDGLVLPVPRKMAKVDNRLGFLHVAPESNYDKEYGLFDHPLEWTI